MDENQTSKTRITQILRNRLANARAQLVLAEEGIVISIDGTPEGNTIEALLVEVNQLQGALDRHMANDCRVG